MVRNHDSFGVGKLGLKFNTAVFTFYNNVWKLNVDTVDHGNVIRNETCTALFFCLKEITIWEKSWENCERFLTGVNIIC